MTSPCRAPTSKYVCNRAIRKGELTEMVPHCSASLPTPRVTTLGRPMANPTSYSARWIRLWPLQIVQIARAEEPGCGHRYTTSLLV